MSALLPSDYPEFLRDLKAKIQARQTRAILAVSRELIGLYWEIGQHVLDFLMLKQGAKERDLQNAILAKLRDFLVELGNGFAFMGSEYPLRVSDQDFYLDLLFYSGCQDS